jgi:hypothetical protein
LSRLRSVILGLGVLGAISLSACESTQDKAAKVQEQAAELVASQVPLAIPKPNQDVNVAGTSLINDENGTAVVVELQNTGKQTIAGVPILVDVKDAKGKTVFTNDAFGLDFALNHVPVMKPGETVFWVNDQVLANGEPKSVKVTIGRPEVKVPPKLPEVAVSPGRIHQDPSGVEVEGTMTNQSQVDQRKLVLFAVARNGGKVVAAGRGAFKNLRAGASRPGTYNIFFIGDPRGAEVTITAPPSVLE